MNWLLILAVVFLSVLFQFDFNFNLFGFGPLASFSPQLA